MTTRLDKVALWNVSSIRRKKLETRGRVPLDVLSIR